MRDRYSYFGALAKFAVQDELATDNNVCEFREVNWRASVFGAISFSLREDSRTRPDISSELSYRRNSRNRPTPGPVLFGNPSTGHFPAVLLMAAPHRFV